MARGTAKIHIKKEPFTNDLGKKIYEGFSRHAVAAIGHNERFDPMAFIATYDGVFAGAVVAELFWGALHIMHVYVEEHFRGQKIATQLIEEALIYGRENKCSFAFLETMSFQALGFYQKMGFQLEFTRSGFKHGTSFHYLKKDLV